jgi:hypothetical protein
VQESSILPKPYHYQKQTNDIMLLSHRERVRIPLSPPFEILYNQPYPLPEMTIFLTAEAGI